MGGENSWWSTVLLTGILLLCVQAATSNEDSKETVCESIDIRNTVSFFTELENCTVIEGYLRILLIHTANSNDYKNLSFPKLREITDYVILYRASGIKSLESLFPNLAVIRGNVLLHHYALMVFEMGDLTDIGLGSLTDILRGSVLIYRNPKLCFLDTIDWNRITKTGQDNNLIMENQQSCQEYMCPSSCPKNPLCPYGNNFGDFNCRLCWNERTCQKMCPSDCERKGLICAGDQCCHPQCLGGCMGTSPKSCSVCKHVYVPSLEMCKEKCPLLLFMYMGRRCIEEQVCQKISVLGSTEDKFVQLKAIKGKCVSECPAGFMENKTHPYLCSSCPGKCPKICDGVLVNSVSAAQKLHGCTIINGSLNIEVKGGSNIIEELEKNLNSIEEIWGFLKVIRSFPLISLNFLRNLTTIHGNILDIKHYALLVYDNQNLQALWDWDSRNRTIGGRGGLTKMEIKRGKVFFHQNPKLCFSKIKEMNKYIAMPPYDELDVSPWTNGDRAACDVRFLNLTVSPQATNAFAFWPNIRNTAVDKRLLIGYVIFYREAPEQNLTVFDGHDACGADQWSKIDVTAPETGGAVFSLVPRLHPFTQYGVYVRTYTLYRPTYSLENAESLEAQSPILYFTTLPDTPSKPEDPVAVSLRYDEITVTWKPPKNPNGRITYYNITGREEIRDAHKNSSHQRVDYCQEALNARDFKKPDIIVMEPSEGELLEPVILNSSDTRNISRQCCTCPEKDKQMNRDERIHSEKIIFEDMLQNLVYIKKLNKQPITNSRSARSIDKGVDFDEGKSLIDLLSTEVGGEAEKSTTPSPHDMSYVPPAFERIIDKPGVLFAHFQGLKHYTVYTVKVIACQDEFVLIDGEKRASSNSPCSMEAIATIRTMPMSGADDIVEPPVVKTDNASMGSIFVKWESPENPNELIFSYKVEYRQQLDNSKLHEECVSQSKYLLSHGVHLTILQPGQYSLRVRARSLAGLGNWSDATVFSIPSSTSKVAPHAVWIIVAVVIISFIIMAGLGTWFFVRKKLGLGVPDGILYASVNPEYMSAGLVYEADEWEVPREKIALMKELGTGSFGMVWAGEAYNLELGKPMTKCAVKTVNESASLREKIEFLQEASVMKAFTCHHVVKLLGVVSKGQPTLVIMELMTNGDLKTYLRSHRPDEESNKGQPPTLRRIFQMAIEIADGMAYLAARKFVHRDLAARNCMVAEDLTVKIGDFGMTRDIYETDYYRKGGKGLLPVRWMAPESLKDGIFDSQSDVWSYGVVLWEMSTLASQPYQGLSNEQVLKYVISGGIMESPENCPDKLYALMKLCWEKNPKARPTFIELIEVLLPDTNTQFHQNSFYFTQRPNFCAVESDDYSEELVTPATPLKSPTEGFTTGVAVPESSSSDENYRFFPSATVLPAADEAGSSNGQAAISEESNHSNQGSKVSSLSNGSLVNGHICVPSVRTTTC